MTPEQERKIAEHDAIDRMTDGQRLAARARCDRLGHLFEGWIKPMDPPLDVCERCGAWVPRPRGGPR
jgi:hypothetical protein